MNGATSRDGLSVGLVDRMHLGGDDMKKLLGLKSMRIRVAIPEFRPSMRREEPEEDVAEAMISQTALRVACAADIEELAPKPLRGNGSVLPQPTGRGRRKGAAPKTKLPRTIVPKVGSKRARTVVTAVPTTLTPKHCLGA